MEKEHIGNYAEAAAYLERVPRFTKKNTMEDTKAFLERLGSPDRNMKIIHIAGTNGKGSVCAYLRAILEEAGYTCGVFTSPHLVDMRERFYVCGRIVPEDIFYGAFMTIYNKLEPGAEKGGYHPTFFEYLFFMALLIFEREKPDYCILETGLGGRLDATNAAAKKEAAVITRIGMDHMEYLGNTLQEIAAEKAGIMRADTPVICLEEPREVSGLLREKAKTLNSRFFPLSKCDYTLLNFKNKSIDFSYHSGYYDYIRLHLRTIALYQMENAALAVRTAEVLDEGRTISALQIARGLEKAFWAGRMEEVEPDFYVDGAHNADGIAAFLDTVRADGFTGSRQLLFGVMKDKDYSHMAQALAESGLFEKISAVQIQNGRAMDTEELKEIFGRYTKQPVAIYRSAAEAYRTLAAGRKENERIYAAGSLYLVGEIKGLIERCGHDQL